MVTDRAARLAAIGERIRSIREEMESIHTELKRWGSVHARDRVYLAADSLDDAETWTERAVESVREEDE